MLVVLVVGSLSNLASAEPKPKAKPKAQLDYAYGDYGDYAYGDYGEYGPDDAYNYDGYDEYGGAVERPENTILPVYEREQDYGGGGGQAVDYDYNDNYDDARYDDN